MKKLYLILGMVALIGFFFTPVMADEAINDGSAGTILQAKWIGALEFESTFFFTDQFLAFENREVFKAGPPTPFPNASAIFHLPSGASLERVDLFAFDNIGGVGNNVRLNLRRENWNGGAPNTTNILTLRTDILDIGVGYTMVSGTPTAIPDLKTIRNAGGYYHAQVSFGNGGQGGALRLFGVRLVYQLQIAPGPDVPTFSDVPLGHMFYDAIEALAASGITAGYPDGSFGPDDFVTRGQMAVFLAKALGLYWNALDGF
jgi:hypothetical protein